MKIKCDCGCDIELELEDFGDGQVSIELIGEELEKGGIVVSEKQIKKIIKFLKTYETN